ncbi:hypothetical protein SynA1825c_01992 [Synechococcus sp. A18-25c]|nr:hypothetical protein SynA1825c_01992 [Synechococcus sp. A18-25c]
MLKRRGIYLLFEAKTGTPEVTRRNRLFGRPAKAVKHRPMLVDI